MHLRDADETFEILPCSAKDQFPQHMSGGFMNFREHGRRYVVGVYRGHMTTRIGGDDWRKFIRDFNLGHGERVVFHMTGWIPKAYMLCLNVGSFSVEAGAEPVDGSEDEKSTDEGDCMEALDEDDKDGDASSDDDEDIVRTRGLQLNEAEDLELQGLLPLSEGFIGLPFVHRLTRTDVHLGMMKIPKKVAASVPFEEQGAVGVYVVGGRFRRIPYNTSNDGRILLGSKEWKDFAASRNLTINTAVLFGFKNSMTDNVDVLLSMKKLG